MGKSTAKRSGQSAVRRLLKQTELANRAAAMSADPELAKKARDEIGNAQTVLPQLESTAIAAVQKLSDANRKKELSAKVADARAVNERPTDAAKKAALAEEASIDQGGAKDQMRDAARDVALATAD